MSILRLEAVTREIGTFVILDRITASIAVGDRIGLVGPNGAGKTTLLRIASGIDEPDSGTVARKRGLTLGLLAQEAHLDEAFMTAGDLRTAVRRGASTLDAMAARLEALEHAGHAADAEYAALQHRFEALGGYTLDQRLDAALTGLGFTKEDLTRSPASLSGGEQTRAALARLVIAQPDLLLLDEPTNHLDIGALEWLEEHLRRSDGSLLVASHDRAFLDATVTRIWELRDRKLTAFRGDYSAYHRQREERDALAVKEAETHVESIAREQELVQRYRSHRKFSKMHEHEARLERLQSTEVEAPRKRRSLRLPGEALLSAAPARSSETVVRLDDLEVGYLPGLEATTPDDVAPGRVDRDDAWSAEGASDDAAPLPPLAAPKVVARAEFAAARRGERIGIVGPNGAGKTTLLRTIAGDLPPLGGAVTFGSGIQLGYLAQLRAAGIPGATVLDAMLEAAPVTPGEARSYLARFLFRGDDVLREVRKLSGGERSRLELALLGVMPSNLYLLDEPTNHLDIVAREAIEAFLLTTPATMLIVSHDRRFLETVCERLWVVDDGLVVPFDGGYRAWREAVAAGWTVASGRAAEAARLRPSTSGKVAGAGAGTGSSGAGERNGSSGGNGRRPSDTDDGAGARARKAAAAVSTAATAAAVAARSSTPNGPKLSKDAYRRQKEAADAELTRLGLRKNHLELAVNNPAVQSNFIELRRITSELADVETALAAAEDAWLAIEERAP